MSRTSSTWHWNKGTAPAIAEAELFVSALQLPILSIPNHLYFARFYGSFDLAADGAEGLAYLDGNSLHIIRCHS